MVGSASAKRKSSAQAGIRVFRPSGCYWLVAVFTVAVFGAFTLLGFHIAVPTWQRLVIAVLTLLSPLVIIEVARRRVELSESGLTIVNLFDRVFIPKADIRAVTWAKGVGVLVQVHEGRWVKLPPVGASSLGLTNTIRAWLKRVLAPSSGGTAPKTVSAPSKRCRLTPRCSGRHPGEISNVFASGVDHLWLRSAAQPGGAAELIVR